MDKANFLAALVAYNQEERGYFNVYHSSPSDLQERIQLTAPQLSGVDPLVEEAAQTLSRRLKALLAKDPQLSRSKQCWVLLDLKEEDLGFEQVLAEFAKSFQLETKPAPTQPASDFDLAGEIRKELAAHLPGEHQSRMNLLLDESLRYIARMVTERYLNRRTDVWQKITGSDKIEARRRPGKSDAAPAAGKAEMVSVTPLNTDDLKLMCSLEVRIDLPPKCMKDLALLSSLRSHIGRTANRLRAEVGLQLLIQIAGAAGESEFWTLRAGALTAVRGQVGQTGSEIAEAVYITYAKPGLPWLTNEILGSQLARVATHPCMALLPRMTWTTQDWRCILQQQSRQGAAFPGWTEFFRALPEVWLRLGGNEAHNAGPLSPAQIKKAARLMTDAIHRQSTPLVCLQAPREWESRALAELPALKLSKPLRRQLRNFITTQGILAHLLVSASLVEVAQQALRKRFPEVSVGARVELAGQAGIE